MILSPNHSGKEKKKKKKKKTENAKRKKNNTQQEKNEHLVPIRMLEKSTGVQFSNEEDSFISVKENISNLFRM